MTTYVALLRAINVGGTGTLAMNDLKRLAEACAFTDVVTYIQSGNLVFKSTLGAARAQAALAQALEKKLKKPVGVFLRTAAQLHAVCEANPFPNAVRSRVLVLFLEE